MAGDRDRLEHSHRIEFPEALDVFLARARELTLVLGPESAAGAARFEATIQQALAARARGDVPAAVRRIVEAMELLAGLVSDRDPREGAALRAAAAQFGRALQGGGESEARRMAEVMRERSGSVLIPKKDR